MLLREISHIIESFAPLHLQEKYDNSGLQIGEPDMIITGALIAIDITESVLDEAIAKRCNLIISHHPLIFSGLKSLTAKNEVEKCVLKAIKNITREKFLASLPRSFVHWMAIRFFR